MHLINIFNSFKQWVQKPGGGASRSNRVFLLQKTISTSIFILYLPAEITKIDIFFEKIKLEIFNYEDKKKKLMKNYITVIQLYFLLIVKCEIISGPSDFAAGIKEQGILACIATKQGGNPG